MDAAIDIFYKKVPADIRGSGVLTNASTIQGSSNNGSGLGGNAIGIINQAGGLIDGNAAGLGLYVEPNPTDGLVNLGTLRASSGGVLVLNGNAGGGFTNTGGVITALAGSGVQLIQGASITGGTLSTAGNGVIRALGGHVASLTGVSNTGAFFVDNNGTANVFVTIANSSSITLNASGNGTRITLLADTSFTGAGSIILANLGGSTGEVRGFFRLTNVSNTIQGEGNLGTDEAALTNQVGGLIDANIAGKTLSVDPRNVASAMVNQGTMQASNGGILQILGSGLAGLGEVDNTGGIIQATGAGSSVQLVSSAVIKNGTLATSGSSIIRTPAGSTATLTDVTNTGTFYGDNNSTTNVSGTIANSGTITLRANGNGTRLTLLANTSLTGTGSLILGNLGGGSTGEVRGFFRLTNGINHTIQGEGSLGFDEAAITNQGIVDANVSGRTLTVDPSNSANQATAFINQGTLRASNGGILLLTGSTGGFTSTSGSAVSADGVGSQVQLNGSVTLSSTTLSTSNNGIIRTLSGSSATLTDVTNTGTFYGENNSTTNVSGTIANSGTITLRANGNPTRLTMLADTSFTGTGSLILGNLGSGGTGEVRGFFRLTNAINHTIQGEGSLGFDEAAITNQGIVDANVSGRTLTVDPSNSANQANAFINQGTLRASNGGTALLVGNGGGDFTNSGTFEVLNGSALTMDASAVLTNNVAGVITGGTYRAVATGGGATQTIRGIAITRVAANTTVELSGTGSVFQVGSTPIESSLTSNGGTLRILNGRSYANVSALANDGIIQLGGGTFNAPLFSNANPSEFFGFGTVTPLISNGNLVRAAGGTLIVSNGINALGSGSTMVVDPGATLDISPSAFASSTQILTHNGTTSGSLKLGATNLTVGGDYTNASFGVGNAFNPRANVTGAGLIVTSGATTQTVTGSISGGATTTPVLAFGSVHEGASPSLSYAINNVASFGPVLRGAIQTAANGGNITDARLGGTGVTAGNFGPIAVNGNSGNLTITFNATTPGALTGQIVHLVNNFDNVQEQNLTITGAAYRFAIAGPLSPNPVQLTSVREGGSFAAIPLTGSNTAVDFAGFTELLNGVFSGPSATLVASGSIANLAPGSSDNSSLTVRLTDTTVGAHSGTVSFNPTSVALAGSGLTNTALPSQSLTVNGSIYRPAVFTAVSPNPVQLAGIREGGTFTAAALTVNNGATSVAGFTETLSTAFSGAVANLTALGTVSNLAPGATNNSAMTVALTNTATAGAKSGTVNVTGTSNPVAGSGLSSLSLTSQPLTVNGNVYRAAVFTALTPSPVQLAGIREGGAFTALPITVNNGATNVAGFAETLSSAFSGAGANVTAIGSVSSLAPGATNNSAMTVALTNTATAGAKTGTVNVTGTSISVGGSGLSNLPLTSQPLTVQGNVFRLASASTHTPEPVNFGVVHVGDSPSQVLTLTNTAAGDGFSEKLNASFSGTSGAATAAGSFTQLNPQATNNSSLSVGMNTTTVGNKTGTATVALASDGTGTSALGLTSLTFQTVNIQGQVNFLAAPKFVFTLGSGTLIQNNATTFTLDFGQVFQNTGTRNASLGVQNFLQDVAFQDTLGGSFNTATVASYSLTSFNTFSNIASGNQLAVGVGFDTARAPGTYNESLVLNPTTTNASGTTGQSPVQLNLKAQVVPEPGSILLLTLGGGLLLGRRRRRASV